MAPSGQTLTVRKLRPIPAIHSAREKKHLTNYKQFEVGLILDMFTQFRLHRCEENRLGLRTQILLVHLIQDQLLSKPVTEI